MEGFVEFSKNSGMEVYKEEEKFADSLLNGGVEKYGITRKLIGSKPQFPFLNPSARAFRINGLAQRAYQRQEGTTTTTMATTTLGAAGNANAKRLVCTFGHASPSNPRNSDRPCTLIYNTWRDYSGSKETFEFSARARTLFTAGD